MTDRPIIFSAPMIRALLDGRKTMTRRIMPYQPGAPVKAGEMAPAYLPMVCGDVTWPLGPGSCIVSNKPGPHPEWVKRHLRYAPGMRLWVRENVIRTPAGTAYVADGGDHYGAGGRLPITPCIHMRRVESRLTLLVDAVKVERLQDISRDDVIAEGITERDGSPIADHVCGWHEPFAALWDSLHGEGAWDSNPWIVAITFRIVKANIDAPSPSQEGR